MQACRFQATKMAGFFNSTPLKRYGFHSDLEVWYKLDFLQPSGSFKDRGIGFMIKTLSDSRPITKLVSSSGGNAGHAVATIGEKINIPVDVFVPTTTLPMMIEKIKATGANVIIGGDNWNAADAAAKLSLSRDPYSQYIPPFDDPLIWEGNSSLVSELKHDLGDNKPDLIILSVGGGGLLRGVQIGLEREGWSDVAILAVETDGAASFRAATVAGRVVSLPKISTVATTLGALAVTSSVLHSAIDTYSFVVSDTEAVSACLAFANQNRVLVEPACGAALAAIESQRWRREHNLHHVRKIAVVVCGGSAVNMGMLQMWKERFEL